MIDGTEFRVVRRVVAWLVSASVVAAVVTAIVLGATPQSAPGTGEARGIDWRVLDEEFGDRDR